MTAEQSIAFAILGLTLALLVWGRWRYDVVAVLALLAVVLTGLIPADDAFMGFSHPAVVTVAAVLIISRGMQNAGVVDLIVEAISPLRGRPGLQMGAQTAVIAVLSSFMNNVGALAVMLPVALRNAYRDGYAPAISLMPLAFGSLLGGLTTMIGTPPNIIIATFRGRNVGEPFDVFDFTPVGLSIAVVGIAFIVAAGWRLLPRDRRSDGADKAFEIDDYITEATVPKGSKAAGSSVREIEQLVESDATIVGIIRDGKRRLAPAGAQRVDAKDILILEGDSESLHGLVDKAGLKLVADQKVGREDIRSSDVELIEAVVTPASRIIGKTPGSLRLRTRYGVNLLALARQGKKARPRLRDMRFRSGDVLLLQGPAETLAETLQQIQCLPLAERSLAASRRRGLMLAGGMFAAAIALVISGILPIHIAFVGVAAGLVLTSIVKPNEVYEAIDWPVIVLLASLFPVGRALELTGATGLVAGGLIDATGGLPDFVILGTLLIGTMLVSDVINNNATAVLMAPVAITVAERMDANVDPFLMAIAVGASCTFLTPIGHQSNTLVMEPAGYRFGDYWRMGLPLDILIVAVAVPMILFVWPL